MIDYLNKVFLKDARAMTELPDNSVQLIVTSPPYFNIKDYSKNGTQDQTISNHDDAQIGDIGCYDDYVAQLLRVWKECFRVLKPNGKLAVNTPLMPMLKKDLNTHYNRHIFDINSDIESSIIHGTELFLYDVYIWRRTNPSKKLMFGSYPYPRNFYAQNTCEFISIYVKDGAPCQVSRERKEKSKITQKEWIEYTSQVWDIPIPSKKDMAFGVHPAIMPEEIALRLIKMFTFVDDLVLDPFAGSGTTLRVAKMLNRDYVGYEISDGYKDIIEKKLQVERGCKC